MNGYLEIVIRSLIAVAFLIIVARLDGARQISQLTFYDYIVGITIGSIAGTLCVDRDINIWYSIIAIAIFSAGSFLISILTSKSIIARRLLTGKPKILVDKGNFVEKNMKISRFDVNDVLRELRNQGYFSLDQVECAILETNGQISVMPKESNRPLTTGDMNIELPQKELVTNVIIDGKIMERNLNSVAKDAKWLHEQVKSQGIAGIKDVLLGTVDSNNAVSLYLKGQTSDNEDSFQ